MSNLNEMSIFARVAQLGSFSAAARSLAAPVSTVSRKVAQLEDRLGVVLIKRTTRKLSLSEHGQQLLAACAPHLQGLADAEAALKSTRAQLEGALRITAPVAFGRGPFVDFIAGLARAHPKLAIDLLITNQFVDLVGSNIDVAIRFGKLPDSSAVAKRIGTSQRVLVAAPSYLARRGMPRHPRDLAEHDCIVFAGKRAMVDWALESSRGRAEVRVRSALAASSLETVSELAVRGLGIALLPPVYAAAGAQNGTLERIMPRWASPPIPVHAVYLSRKFVPAKIQTFIAELGRWQNGNMQY